MSGIPSINIFYVIFVTKIIYVSACKCCVRDLEGEQG